MLRQIYHGFVTPIKNRAFTPFFCTLIRQEKSRLARRMDQTWTTPQYHAKKVLSASATMSEMRVCASRKNCGMDFPLIGPISRNAT